MRIRLPFKLHAVAAMAENRVIGRDGALPWHLPGDLKLFKELTLGRSIIMGRRTWESLGRPLPGRENIVVSRANPPGEADGATLVSSIDALKDLTVSGDAYLIGGAQLYNALLPSCDSLYLTLVKGNHQGDTFFPEFEKLFELDRILVEEAAFKQCLYIRMDR
jgi:dihydrofolate reductase